MENFQPPTDNLYKFLAIAGLVLIITAIVAPLKVVYDLRVKQFDLIAKEASARAEFESWQGAEQRLLMRKEKSAKNFDQLRKYVEDHPVESIPADTLNSMRAYAERMDAQSDSFWQEHERNVERAAAADRAIGEMKAKHQELDFLSWAATATLWSASVLLLMGVSMTVSGFWLWYVRSQRYLDELLVAELKEKRAAA